MLIFDGQCRGKRAKYVRALEIISLNSPALGLMRFHYANEQQNLNKTIPQIAGYYNNNASEKE